jgi:hypothetical protein
VVVRVTNSLKTVTRAKGGRSVVISCCQGIASSRDNITSPTEMIFKCVAALAMNFLMLALWKPNDITDDWSSVWYPRVSYVCSAWWVLWAVLVVRLHRTHYGPVPPTPTWLASWEPSVCMGCGGHVPGMFRRVTFRVFDNGYHGGVMCFTCSPIARPPKSE